MTRGSAAASSKAVVAVAAEEAEAVIMGEAVAGVVARCWSFLCHLSKRSSLAPLLLGAQQRSHVPSHAATV